MPCDNEPGIVLRVTVLLVVMVAAFAAGCLLTNCTIITIQASGTEKIFVNDSGFHP